MRLPDKIVRRLQRWADRYMETHPVSQRITGQVPQDLLILRWDIFSIPGITHVRLHKILGSDEARALHDHPWWSITAMVEGVYTEVVPNWVHPSVYVTRQDGEKWLRRNEGDIVIRGKLARHRLVLDWRREGDEPSEKCYPLAATSLFIHGPNVRTWGFWNEDGSFTPAPNQRRMARDTTSDR